MSAREILAVLLRRVGIRHAPFERLPERNEAAVDIELRQILPLDRGVELKPIDSVTLDVRLDASHDLRPNTLALQGRGRSHVRHVDVAIWALAAQLQGRRADEAAPVFKQPEMERRSDDLPRARSVVTTSAPSRRS